MSFASADASAENGWVNTADARNPAMLTLAWEILQTSRYCTLSTCSPDGVPWASPVFFCHQGWRLYWSSAIASQHSQNLYQNQGRLAIALYPSDVPEGTGKGLYLAGTATEITDPAISEAAMHRLFAKSGSIPPNRTVADYLGDSPRRFYEFQPQAVWVTGDRLPHGNQLVDTKIHLDLPTLLAHPIP